MRGERRGMQGNAKLTWEWVQCARGMQGNGKYQGNAKRMYGSGCKVPGEFKGMYVWVQRVHECRGMHRNTRET